MKILIVTTAWKPEASGIAEATFSRVVELGRLLDCQIRVLAPDYSAYARHLPDYRQYIGQISPNIDVKTYPTRVVKSVVKLSTEARLVQPFWKYSFDAEFEDFEPHVLHVEEPCRLFGPRLFDGHLKRVGIRYKRAHDVIATCMWRTDYFEYAKTLYGPRRASLLTRALLPVFRWVYNAYDSTFCSTGAAHTKLTWAGVRNLIQVQSHGIDVNKFKKQPSARSDDSCRLLYVGRVSKEKNVTQMLHAFRVLSERYPNLQLTVVGGGPTYDELSRQYATHGRIAFLGKIENDQLPQIYSENDVFINPSHTETFGLTTLEACACSMPVVVADQGGFLTDADEKSLKCLRYKHDDCDHLIATVDKLIRDRELRGLLARNAREVALSYDTSKVARNFYDHWQRLMRREGLTGTRDEVPSGNRYARAPAAHRMSGTDVASVESEQISN